MKQTLLVLFTGFLATLGFAQDMHPLISINDLEVKPNIEIREEISPIRKSFLYVRMEVSDSQPYRDVKQVIPGLGIGYRLAWGPSAIDLSGSYSFRAHSAHYLILPKANYLRYLSPDVNSSIYLGGGLAWAWMSTKNDERFGGLVPNLTAGYEMNRNANWRTFVQLDVSQPAIPSYQENGFPGPYAELSVGAGF